MKLYELICEISINLSGEEIESLTEKMSGFLSEAEGKIEKITNPYKIKLAYRIKSQTEAYLVSFIFEINPEKLGELEKKLKEEKNIIRHMIVRKATEKAVYEKISGLKEPEEPKKTKKVGLKEIDQKIEEILSE